MSEEREVSLGCGAWLLGMLMVFALWDIGAELGHIVYQLTLANCIAEAKSAVLCPAAKDKPAQ